MLDLGAIGKGYAIGRAVDILREAGLTSALVHGGTSTVFGLGHPPDAEFWKVAVENPRRALQGARSGVLAPTEGKRTPGETFATVPLRDQAMSVSAIWGRSFLAEGKTYGHVLDPRTGMPVSGAVLAAVVLPSATETDALSTALLVLGMEGQKKIAGLRAGMKTMVAAGEEGQFRVETIGIAIESSKAR
jgi:thiamine biosynthesis lipoprotein